MTPSIFPTYFLPFKENKSNRVGHLYFLLLTGHFGVLAPNFLSLTGHFGVLTANFLSLTGQFGVLTPNFLSLTRHFGVLTPNFLPLIRHFGVLTPNFLPLTDYIQRFANHFELKWTINGVQKNNADHLFFF